MSTLDPKHPQYEAAEEDWVITRDVYAGERRIKEQGQEYLPATAGMIADGMNEDDIGRKVYEAYKYRAIWHDLFEQAIAAYLGMLHNKPATITLPDGMDGVVSNLKEDLQALLRRINEEQLTTGRLGLLADMPSNPAPGKDTPYIAMYYAENVRNWDAEVLDSNQYQLNWAILDESGLGRQEENRFAWQDETRYRLVEMMDGIYHSGLFRGLGKDADVVYDATLMFPPSYQGKTLTDIPFVFVNSKDNMPNVDKPPLLGLANMMLGVYRGEADYRYNLFMSGQDTLVVIGGVRKDPSNPDKPLRTGAGARIDVDIQGDAKYVGVSGAGLPEQGKALDALLQRAEVRAGQLVNARVGDKESGEALKTRMAAQTATLKQIALTSSEALQRILKMIALWMGKDPNVVRVEPNLEFGEWTLTGQDLAQMMDAKDKGLPVSYESIHEYLVDHGVTKMNFEDEIKAIEAERELAAKLKDPVAQEHKNRELDNSDPANQPRPIVKPPTK